MELEPQALTKRLSFGEIAFQQNNDYVEDVIKAIKAPSVDNFERAVELLHYGYANRFDKILDTAKEQSAAVGEADLRRLKRQFSSLKNTFLHYEVKEEFIAALADGLPNGTEEVQLAQFEEEVARNVQHLRALKANNEEAQVAIGELVDEINARLEGLEGHRTRATEVLTRLRQEVERHEAEMAQLPLPPQLPEGPNEEECQEALTAAAAETRDLEAHIAQQLAEAAELEAALAAEQHEVELLKSQVADLRLTAETQAKEQQQNTQNNNNTKRATNSRYSDTLAWAENTTTLISSLAGVSIIPTEDTDEVVLDITTTYPTGAVVGGGTLGSCATAVHRLTLTLDSNNCVVGGSLNKSQTAVAGGDDVSSTVDVEGIVGLVVKEAAEGGGSHRGIEFVVREVAAKLASVLHSQALVNAAVARFPGTVMCIDDITTGNSSGEVCKAPLPKGGLVTLKLVSSWPAGDDVVEIVNVQCVSEVDQVKGNKVKGLLLDGRGYLQGVEAVVREINATAD